MKKTNMIFLSVLFSMILIVGNISISFADNGLNYDPPLKQIKEGVEPQDVKCNENKVLFFKSSTFSPVCIFSDSFTKLEQRKYVSHYSDYPLSQTIDVTYNNPDMSDQTIQINYLIENGNVTKITKETHKEYLDIDIIASDDGVLYLELPRMFLDSIVLGTNTDDLFLVLIDGNEVLFKEIQTTSIYRTLKINFTANSELIEIFGVR